jgi:LmbE family N-acetylglucosaminyl deacetylase
VTSESKVSLFLSPHFDDVALSCGGIAALAARSGSARVVTVFAGQPPAVLTSFARFQHARWGAGGDAVDLRRAEDAAAMEALGASPTWLDFPDAIYRGDLYLADADLFGPVKPRDAETAAAVQDTLAGLFDSLNPTKVYAPLGIGGHVDHRLTRDTSIACARAGCEIYLYEDLPYAANAGAVERWIAVLPIFVTPLLTDITDTMDAKLRSIAAYASQLPTIFRHLGEWESVTRDYASRLARRDDAYAERTWRVEIQPSCVSGRTTSGGANETPRGRRHSLWQTGSSLPVMAPAGY